MNTLFVHKNIFAQTLYFQAKKYFCSDGDPFFFSRKRILIQISRGLDSILTFIKHFFPYLKLKLFFLLNNVR